MIENFREVLKSTSLRLRLVAIAGLLIVFHGGILLAVLLCAGSHPTLVGLTVLAYGLGLRHAVDPDHIAAIDNSVRKLMQERKTPVAVGFFFSVGHSTIVVVLSALVALSASFLTNTLPHFRDAGSLIATSVSCFFLLTIGLINLIVLVDTFKTWRHVIGGGAYCEKTLEEHLNSRGFLARLLRPVLRMVGNSWNMYWVGLLFGLGFDTATEVALLSISASTGATNMPFWVGLLIPLAFTTGMTLIDTIDGVMMLGAYGWAFLKPVRKLYYNLSITFISVVIALLIGSMQALQAVSRRMGLNGGIWSFANGIELEDWGFYIIGIFILSWIASVLFYKWRGYDRLPVYSSE